MTTARRWWATAGSALTLGFVVGIPYYSMPYFYDYFEQPHNAGGYGWPRSAILLGLPVGSVVPLLAGPLCARWISPRVGIVAGAWVCAAAIAGFGWMEGNLAAYFGLWLLYMAGWTAAGPMNHQLLLTRLFGQNRGSALALAFFGLSLFGALSVVCLARPLTQALGFAGALRAIGGVMLLSAPIAWLSLPSSGSPPPQSPGHVVRASAAVWSSRIFWLLLSGSTLTIAGIGGISQHLKLILRERGYSQQSQLDEIFGWTVLLMLGFSAAGRFAFGWTADRFPKKHVITVAFLFMLAAIPLLLLVGRMAGAPYWFAVCFGFGMSSDTLLLTLLAAEHFDSGALPRAMGVIVPVNTIGQTWFPFAVSLLWEASGGYTVPLVVIFSCILAGRILLFLVPERHAQPI